MKRQFKGLWMPVDILQDKKLNHTQKILYCEIVSLCQVDKCYASNKHFAASLDISERSVQRNLEALKEAGYIRVNVVRDENNLVIKRTISVVKIDYKHPRDESVTPHDASNVTPHDASVQNLTTPASYINTHLNTQRESTRTHEVFELNEALVEKLANVQDPLERMKNSLTFEGQIEKLAKQYLKRDMIVPGLTAMSNAIERLNNYESWYKREDKIFKEFKGYLENPTKFAEYKKAQR